MKPERVNRVDRIVGDVGVMIETLRVTETSREGIWAGPAAGEGVIFSEPGVVEAGGVVAFGQREALTHFVGDGIFLRRCAQPDAGRDLFADRQVIVPRDGG